MCCARGAAGLWAASQNLHRSRNRLGGRSDGPDVRRRDVLLGVGGLATLAACGASQASDSRVAAPPAGDDVDAPPEVSDESTLVRVGGSRIAVEVEGSHPLPPQAYADWARNSAEMITDYYGGEFPVPSLEVRVVPGGRGGVGFGQHQDGRWIKIYCGRRTGEDTLESDWVMVHEMLHACFPDLTRRHRWMQEGCSTYVEKVVRARAGNRSEESVWRALTGNMHHGRPKFGDRGLDRTPTWGRTYWGGALFFMVADIEIRTQTDNRKSLRDALVKIVAEGGNGRANWSTKKVVEVGDQGTGTRVLRDLYARMAEAPGDVDLDRLWRELGVQRVDGEVSFDDDAPLAGIRRAITRA